MPASSGCSPAPFILDEVGIGVGELVSADPIVGDAAEIEIAAVLAHRGDHRMIDAAEVPQRVEHFAALVELDDASGVDIRKQPFVYRNPLAHSLAEARHLPGEVERGAAHADHRQPIVSVGRKIDIVGIARQVVDDRFDLARPRAIEPIAFDRAAEGFGEQDRFAVAGDTDAIWKFQPAQHRARGPVVRIVADDAAVAARLQSIDRPLVHFVSNGGFGEEDASVVGNVEIVGEPQPAVVVDGIKAAVGLIRHLLDLSIRRDAVEAHTADADVEIVGAIERHAERLAADMGEYLHLLVVGRQEADDVAVARTGIEIVVAIENDVFRRFDAAEADQRHVAQFVVLRERPTARFGRSRRGQPMKGWADIDLADDARPVLQPANIDGGGDQQDAGQHHAIDAAADRQRGQAVDHKQNDQRADQRLGHRAFAAAEADAAQHGRGQNGYFEADADVAADGAEPRGEKQRADRGQHPACGVAQRDRAPHRNAGIVGRAARAADRGDMPSRTQTREEDMSEHGDNDIDQHDARHAHDPAAAQEIPGGNVGEGGGDLVGIVEQQKVVGRPVDDERNQRGDEGAQPQVPDQQAVDGAERHAAQKRRGDDRRHRPVENVEAEQGAEVAQREHRSHREIDAADDDDDRHAEHDEADFAGLPSGVGQSADRQEAGDRPAQQYRDDQENDDRDRGFGPALG